MNKINNSARNWADVPVNITSDLSVLSIRLLMANHPLTAWEQDSSLARLALI